MKRKQILSSLLAGALVFSSAVILTGCSKGENKTIAVILKSEESYWDIVKNGVNVADEEFENYTAVFNAPETEDADKQKQMIKDMIANGADAIAIAPVNDTVFKELEGTSIPVIAIDTPSGVDSVPYIGTDNNIAGMVAGENTCSLIKEKISEKGNGKIAVIRLSENSTNTNQRGDGFVSSVKHTAGDIEILDNGYYCNAERDKAKEIAISLIKENKDLKIIYAVNQTSTLGVCDAIKEMTENGTISSGDVTAVGFDSCDEEIEFMKSGILYGFVVQNPYNMGYEGFKNAVKLLENKKVDLSVDTKSYFVSMNNLEDEEIKKLINPLN